MSTSLLNSRFDKPMGAKEHIFWRKLTVLRNRAEQATNVRDALTYVYEFDRPYFLEKWWRELSKQEKKNGYILRGFVMIQRLYMVLNGGLKSLEVQVILPIAMYI